MTHIIDVPENDIKNLRETFYDVESYKTIMVELLKNCENYNELNYNLFNDFREHYKDALIAYDTAKINFEFDFVKAQYPNATAWNVTFGDNKVAITA